MPRKGPRTHARLGTFARGAIWGMASAGVPSEEICRKVNKTDGTSPTLRAVKEVIAKAREEPDWRGENSSAGVAQET